MHQQAGSAFQVCLTAWVVNQAHVHADPCWVALRDIDFDLCVNTDVVNDVLESELNEVELVVAKELGKAHGALGADTLGAGFELVEVLSRDVEASGELGEGLLVRLTDTGKELGKGERPGVERLEKGVGGSVELLGLGGNFLGGHGQYLCLLTVSTRTSSSEPSLEMR